LGWKRLRRIAISERLFLGVLNIGLMSALRKPGIRNGGVGERTYWLKSNIGIALSGRILLYRNLHPAENGAIGTSRLVLAYDSFQHARKVETEYGRGW